MFNVQALDERLHSVPPLWRPLRQGYMPNGSDAAEQTQRSGRRSCRTAGALLRADSLPQKNIFQYVAAIPPAKDGTALAAVYIVMDCLRASSHFDDVIERIAVSTMQEG